MIEPSESNNPKVIAASEVAARIVFKQCCQRHVGSFTSEPYLIVGQTALTSKEHLRVIVNSQRGFAVCTNQGLQTLPCHLRGRGRSVEELVCCKHQNLVDYGTGICSHNLGREVVSVKPSRISCLVNFLNLRRA